MWERDDLCLSPRARGRVGVPPRSPERPARQVQELGSVSCDRFATSKHAQLRRGGGLGGGRGALFSLDFLEGTVEGEAHGHEG